MLSDGRGVGMTLRWNKNINARNLIFLVFNVALLFINISTINTLGEIKMSTIRTKFRKANVYFKMLRKLRYKQITMLIAKVLCHNLT